VFTLESRFPGHAVNAVCETAWRSSKDGPLLAHAQEHFDVFVTIDRKLEHQHNLKGLKLGFVFARVPTNKIASYRPIFAELRKAAENVKPGEAIHVVNPQMRV
jgi:hypothetical protein